MLGNNDFCFFLATILVGNLNLVSYKFILFENLYIFYTFLFFHCLSIRFGNFYNKILRFVQVLHSILIVICILCKLSSLVIRQHFEITESCTFRTTT